MQKIISLFQRNYEGDRLVRNEVVPGAEWVLAGEGVPTRKFDGTCCLIRDGRLYKRYDAKRGRLAPLGFEPAQDPDPVTGHWPGWVPVGLTDYWHLEAFARIEGFNDGTYELVGPKVNGNPEQFERHALVRHGSCVLSWFTARDFESIREQLRSADIEGVVWHHPDGRMVKIKKKDFGLKRAVP